jgi:hypothetical protein
LIPKCKRLASELLSCIACRRKYYGITPALPHSSTASLQPASTANLATILGLRVVLLVLGQPDILDKRSVPDDLGHEDHHVPHGGLGPPLPDDGQHAGDHGPHERARGEAGPEHDEAVHHEQDLQGEEEEGEQEADEDEVGRVLEEVPDARDERLHHRPGRRHRPLQVCRQRAPDDLERRLRREDVVLEELDCLLGEDACAGWVGVLATRSVA